MRCAHSSPSGTSSPEARARGRPRGRCGSSAQRRARRCSVFSRMCSRAYLPLMSTDESERLRQVLGAPAVNVPATRRRRGASNRRSAGELRLCRHLRVRAVRPNVSSRVAQAHRQGLAGSRCFRRSTWPPMSPVGVRTRRCSGRFASFAARHHRLRCTRADERCAPGFIGAAVRSKRSAASTATVFPIEQVFDDLAARWSLYRTHTLSSLSQRELEKEKMKQVLEVYTHALYIQPNSGAGGAGWSSSCPSPPTGQQAGRRERRARRRRRPPPRRLRRAPPGRTRALSSWNWASYKDSKPIPPQVRPAMAQVARPRSTSAGRTALRAAARRRAGARAPCTPAGSDDTTRRCRSPSRSALRRAPRRRPRAISRRRSRCRPQSGRG